MASEGHVVTYCLDCVLVSEGKPKGQLTAEQEKVYGEAKAIFLDAMIGVLADHLQDVYLHHKTSKGIWDALNADYGGSDTATELYIIGQYHDYKMVDGRNVVEQAHEI
jgi:hypothetical protein